MEDVTEGGLPEAALRYAEMGWAVLPLRPRSKDPAISGGVLSASSDPEQVAQWWRDTPAANIGIAAGPSGLVIIDIDPRNGGDVAPWLDFETALVESGKGDGGAHLYFAAPDDVEALGTTIPGVPGVDVQRGRKYVVAPPSIHPDTGDPYVWVRPGVPAPLPQAVIDAATRAVTPGREAGLPDALDDRPGSLWMAQTTWASLLEPHGYALDHMVGDVAYWRRPGVGDHHGMTTNWMGLDRLVVFTSESDFEGGKTYDKIGALAVLSFGGDAFAALASISETAPVVVWNPPPEAAGPVYAFEPAFAPGHWIADYIAYASERTDAAFEYHEAAGLALLASVCWGHRLALAPVPRGLDTNLYVALVGVSTRSRKSTSQGLAIDLLDEVRPGTKLGSRMTTEGAVNVLQARKGSSALWAPDELGVALSEIARKDYLSGFEELLLTLYGGEEYVYVKVNDTVVVKDVSLGVLGAATPESLAMSGQRSSLDGLLPRVAVVFPDALPPARPMTVSGNPGGRTEILHGLMTRYAFGRSNPDHAVTIEADALALLNAAEAPLADQLHTVRLPAMLYKVATLSALGALRTVVQLSDAVSAVRVVDRWAAGAKRLLPYMRRNSSSLEFEHSLNDVLLILKDLGGTAPRPQIAREVRMERGALTRLRDTLVDRALIDVVVIEAGPLDKLEHWTVR